MKASWKSYSGAVVSNCQRLGSSCWRPADVDGKSLESATLAVAPAAPAPAAPVAGAAPAATCCTSRPPRLRHRIRSCP